MKWALKKTNCIFLTGALLLCNLCGCSATSGLIQIRSTGVAMGTVISMNLYVESQEQGREAIERINQSLQSLEQDTLSWRLENSEVWKINQAAGEEVMISDKLLGYLEDVWEISEKSEGALDVTVGQVTGLWNIDEYADNPEGFRVPEQSEIADLLKNTGYEKIDMEKQLYLPEGMSLDLGAVGKGIASDEIKEILKELEIPAAVISVGGSNVTHGRKSDGTDWVIGIAHPREEGSFLGYLSLDEDMFVATSGDYERVVCVDDMRYHHIMDPDTGYPANSGLCSVTIVGESGLLCDALSTACFVLGKDKGIKLVKQLGAQALFVETDGNVTMTEGLESMWTKE